ncbi:hypothetical protein [Leifsonia sp. C5G2]|uniref:hypothetical protein n=1 Tax=Leifsonia sp. C5G2 TaxID=2735269 RepID=UPI001585CC03|nr:hypothetical protein [Leifsonia sp. C5G2]NUU06615.1 hypothetical protein [Leifsonia sp. C5G2]
MHTMVDDTIAAPAATTPDGAATTPVPRRRTKAIALAAVVAVAACAGAYFAVEGITRPNSTEAKIARTVDRIEKQAELPRKLDAVTTWTAVEAEKSGIQYRYRVELPAGARAVVESDVRDMLVSRACGIAETRDVLDDGVHLDYEYTMTNGNPTVNTRITAKDC